MKIGDVWFKKRQLPERERFFVIKGNRDHGFIAITMAKGSFFEDCFIGAEAIAGFEKNNLLTESEIAKYILLGDLDPVIL